MKTFARVSAAVATAIGLAAVGLVLSPTGHAIVGGRVEAEVGSNVAIFGCSGSLVSREWVLAARHCYESLGDEGAIWGSLDLGKGNKVKVVEACHLFDVAMARIDPPLPEILPEGVEIAEIHTVTPPVGATVTVKGWGEEEHGTGKGGGILRSTDVQVVEPWNGGMGDAYGGPSFTVNKLNGGGMTAHGDSGGPAFYEGKIVGVDSNGDREGANYARIEPNLHWIKPRVDGSVLPVVPTPAPDCMKS